MPLGAWNGVAQVRRMNSVRECGSLQACFGRTHNGIRVAEQFSTIMQVTRRKGYKDIRANLETLEKRPNDDVLRRQPTQGRLK